MHLFDFIEKNSIFKNEADVQLYANNKLNSGDLGFVIHQHKLGIEKIDRAFPSKAGLGIGKPDLLLCSKDERYPVCIWENKDPNVSALSALSEAKFYIEGLFSKLSPEPSLPRLAVGFNGKELCMEYYNNERRWVPLKCNGIVLKDQFFSSDIIRNGVNSKGEFLALKGWASEKDLRDLLPKLKTVYRYIPSLVSGRKPIDFTIALLTLRMLIERNKSWGSWSEQPTLAVGADSFDHAVRERLKTLSDRILSNKELSAKYGEIFEFREKNDNDEISFSFTNTLNTIEIGHENFAKIFNLLDSIPPLEHADFDVFGEVYQQIGDNATKKALGQFFTGRHIISALLPILAKRSGIDQDKDRIKNIKVCDPACGTGGFLTELFRFIKKSFNLTEIELSQISKNAFYGFDLSHSNASRASVNMYFAGDGFSRIEGGYNSLDSRLVEDYEGFFDFVVTNPPYGKSSYGRAEEAFLQQAIKVLKAGGWGVIVLPNGTLENPRSRDVRFNLLKYCHVTDAISLPKHTFAPYTQQKTAIVIFQKRKEALHVADGDIQALIEEIKEENVNLFIVDNDGYANSDKRYPTDSKADTGEWLHNDLADWIDNNGKKKTSVIYRSLIGQSEPLSRYSEFGVPLRKKYRLKSFSECFTPLHRDLALLPDIYLRNEHEEITISDYQRRVAILDEYWDGKNDVLEGRFLNELVSLTTLNVIYGSDVNYVSSKINDIFKIYKGSQGFTEEVIYRNHSEHGIPVYGGGTKPMGYKVKPATLNNKGIQVKVFSAPAIVVSMDGSSGYVQVIREGMFTANHHAAVLQPYSSTIDLDWIAQAIGVGLKKEASNKEGSATLTKERLELFKVDVPTPLERRKYIGDTRRRLIKLMQRFLD